MPSAPLWRARQLPAMAGCPQSQWQEEGQWPQGHFSVRWAAVWVQFLARKELAGGRGRGWGTRAGRGAACGAVIRARWHRRGASSYGFSRAGGRQRQPGDGDGRCMHGWRRCTSPSVIPPPPRVDLFFTTGLSDATTSIRTY
uniref:Uncharacterized protein n=1 Tax=Oryza sativa subsp. japonica TaxID=39947 RepID=Q69RD0_ORYSJ|nr:hypothetical protein [Oryza sativa Japonica Group]